MGWSFIVSLSVCVCACLWIQSFDTCGLVSGTSFWPIKLREMSTSQKYANVNMCLQAFDTSDCAQTPVKCSSTQHCLYMLRLPTGRAVEWVDSMLLMCC